jgi:PAS domain S-box-containing protein
MKADPGSDSADASSRTRLRVLIVEDSEDDALLLLRELRLGGYEPASAERVDTPEAMRWALAEGEPWDVVLSDWRMPRFSATEALAMLRATDSEAPFVIVSGKVGEEAAVEAMRSGAHDYVMKGNLARLCATVERGLQEAEARRERRRAEEERDRLFEFSLDLLGVAGLDGYFKRVNPAFVGTLGYSSEELLAKPFIEFVHPEDRAATMGELEGLGRGTRTAFFENRYLRKDGAQVWLEWKAVPAVNEDLIYATARDVTERKRAEDALRRREAILRAVAFAAERFLERVASWEESAPEVLERLGTAAEVSRVYIFENYLGEDGEVWSTQRNEWAAPGVPAQMNNPRMEAFPYLAAGYGRWTRLMERGDPVHGRTREFPENEQRELKEQGIRSIAIVPIFVIGEWWGTIGFDDCLAEREWSTAEIDALKAAADTLGAAIQREQAEETIRQSEQLYRTVVEQATEYISLVDVETRRFVGSNPAFREALGYTEEELKRMTLYDVVAHDRQSIDENARRVVERGRYFLGERKHRRKDGSLVDVEVSASTVLHNRREVVCVVGHDVTERKRVEEALKESEERYRRLVELSPDSIMVHDGEKVLFANAAGAELFGATSPEELVGKQVMDFVPPDHQEILRARITGMQKRGERANLTEERFLRLDGRTVDVEGVATPITYWGEAAVLAVARDITERKRAREALTQSEERYRAVVEQAAEGIFLFDAATGAILESNAALQELLGYTAAELACMRIYDFVAHDRESIDSNIRLIVDEGCRFVGERRYRRKDGSLADVEVAANLISYGGREVICTVIRDVTGRIEAFRMLEERVTALAGISASLTVGQTIEATLDALAVGIVQSTAAIACAVVLMDEETGLLRTAGSHGLPDDYTAALEAAYRAGMRPPPVEVFRTRRPLLVRDARQAALNTPFSSPLHGYLHEVSWDTIYFVPLVSRGRALGVLNLYYLPGEEPSEDEIVFLGAVADQTAVALENAGLFAAARGKAALEERQRLARELHDSVSQALYGIALGARTARALLGREGPPERVDEWLEYVLSLAEAGLTEMRALIFELRPESLETEGLIVALKQQAAALEARHELPVHTTLGEEPELPLEAKEALYRIAQEALHNTVKHARASRADLKLEHDARGIALEVSDDGAGFDPGRDFSGHLGLKSMRERTARLGGTLRVESIPGEGTNVRVQIPLGT